MILIDSSVWIDNFNGKMTAEVSFLHNSLGRSSLLVGDIVMTEVLQGFRHDNEFNLALRLLNSLPIVEVVNQEIGLKAAQNFRFLRARGITVRKTIDTLIATCCIENDYALLYSDRDFDPFVEHLGMKSAFKGA